MATQATDISPGPGGDAPPIKKDTSEDERRELAEKLDKELDEFIAGLEKRTYTEGWSEDKWQEEMEKHPFFMSRQPEEGEELSPLMEGIQQLKYDTTENTPEELANNYKEDGNFNFKCKNYRMAIISYTQGLKQKSTDPGMNAQLYNNRAASHFFLKNFRSCYNDCKAALKILPGYKKAKWRLAQASFEIGHFEESVKLCDDLYKSDRNNKQIIDLRRKAADRKIIIERDKRREFVEKKKAELDQKKLLEALKQRGVKFLEKDGKINLNQTLFPEVFKRGVHFQNDSIVWPVVLMYPEHKISDFVQEFNEDDKFQDQLIEVLKETPPWDTEKKYKAKSVRLYFEDVNGKIHNVDKTSTLRSVLSNPLFRVDRGTPVFIVVVKNSKTEKHFLENVSTSQTCN